MLPHSFDEAYMWMLSMYDVMSSYNKLTARSQRGPLSNRPCLEHAVSGTPSHLHPHQVPHVLLRLLKRLHSRLEIISNVASRDLIRDRSLTYSHTYRFLDLTTLNRLCKYRQSSRERGRTVLAFSRPATRFSRFWNCLDSRGSWLSD